MVGCRITEPHVHAAQKVLLATDREHGGSAVDQRVFP